MPQDISPNGIPNENPYSLGRIVSLAEEDNLVMILEITKDLRKSKQRIYNIKHIFLNGKEDCNGSRTKINKKNNRD